MQPLPNVVCVLSLNNLFESTLPSAFPEKPLGTVPYHTTKNRNVSLECEHKEIDGRIESVKYEQIIFEHAQTFPCSPSCGGKDSF